eukprot:PhF_6_TR7984/c0_g1_i2/m.12225/K11789/VPRBP, DCAF1; HIV-1 Vpr-binding protein
MFSESSSESYGDNLLESGSRDSDMESESLPRIASKLCRELEEVILGEGPDVMQTRVTLMGKLCKLLQTVRNQMRTEHRETLKTETFSDYAELCSAVDSQRHRTLIDALYRYAFDRTHFGEDSFLAMYLLVLLAEGECIDVEIEQWEDLARDTVAQATLEGSIASDPRTSLRICLLSFISNESDEQLKLVSKNLPVRWVFRRLQQFVQYHVDAAITSSTQRPKRLREEDTSPQEGAHPVEWGNIRRVVRGPQWEWGLQDGGAGNAGNVVAFDHGRGEVCILWDRQARYYRYTITPEHQEVQPYSDEEAYLRQSDVDLVQEEIYSLLSLIVGISTVDKDCVSGALSTNTVHNIFMLLHDPNEDTVSCALHAIRNLMSFRKLALLFFEKLTPSLFESLLTHKSNVVRVEAVRLLAYIFKQNLLCKAVSIWGIEDDDLASNPFTSLFGAALQHVKSELGPLKGEAIVLLAQAFKVPFALNIVDTQPLTTILSSGEVLTHMAKPFDAGEIGEEKSRQCFIQAIQAYLQSHMIAATRPLWKKHRRLQTLAPRSSWEAVSHVSTFLETIEDIIGDQSISAETKSDILRPSRIPCAKAIIEAQIHVSLLEAMQSRNPDVIVGSTNFLALLSLIDTMPLVIASVQVERPRSSASRGMGIILTSTLTQASPSPEKTVPAGLKLVLNLIWSSIISEHDKEIESNPVIQLLREHDGFRVLWNLIDMFTKEPVDHHNNLEAVTTLLRVFHILCSCPSAVQVFSGLNLRSSLVFIRENSHLAPLHDYVQKVITQYDQVSCEVLRTGSWSEQERCDVVLRTPIRVNKAEITDLVYAYLRQEGLTQAAEAVRAQVPNVSISTSTTLTEIMEKHVRHQHMNCVHPVSTLPECSVLKQHKCSEKTNVYNMAQNVALRNHLVSLGFGSSEVVRTHQREFKYRYGQYRTYETLVDEGEPLSVCFLGEDAGLTLVGTSRNVIVAFQGEDRTPTELNITDGVDVDPDPEIIGLKEHGVLPVFAAGFPEFTLIKRFPVDSGSHFKIRNVNSGSAEFGRFQHQLVLCTLADVCLPVLYDYETQTLSMSFQDDRSAVLGKKSRASLSMDDNLILNECVLWDKRCSTSPIHRYDKLSEQNSGIFHHNGCHVIVDIGVWDLRTHRLLRTCSAFNNRDITMNTSDAIFAVNPTSISIIDGHNYNVLSQKMYSQVGDISAVAIGPYDTDIAITYQGIHGHECVHYRTDMAAKGNTVRQVDEESTHSDGTSTALENLTSSSSGFDVDMMSDEEGDDDDDDDDDDDIVVCDMNGRSHSTASLTIPPNPTTQNRPVQEVLPNQSCKPSALPPTESVVQQLQQLQQGTQGLLSRFKDLKNAQCSGTSTNMEAQHTSVPQKHDHESYPWSHHDVEAPEPVKNAGAAWTKLKTLRIAQLAKENLTTELSFTPYEDMDMAPPAFTSPRVEKLFVGGLRYEMDEIVIARVLSFFGGTYIPPSHVEIFRRGDRPTGCAAIYLTSHE